MVGTAQERLCPPFSFLPLLMARETGNQLMCVRAIFLKYFNEITRRANQF